MANNDPVNVTVGNSGRKVHRAYLAHNGQASTVCGAERRGLGVTHTRRTDRPVDCLACSPAPVVGAPLTVEVLEAPTPAAAVEIPADGVQLVTVLTPGGSRTHAARALRTPRNGETLTEAASGTLCGAGAGEPLRYLADTVVTCRACCAGRPAVDALGHPAPGERLEAPATCTPAYYTTPRRAPLVADPAELELEAAARRRQLDAAVVEDMLAGDVEPLVAEPRAPRVDDYRADAPVDLAGTLNSLARHGRVIPLNARRAFVKTPAGRLLVAEVVTTPGGRPTAPGRFRQLAIDPQAADEDGAQLDLFEAVAAEGAR